MENLRIGHGYLNPDKLDFEIVERKGLGHPDTLADALAEIISVDYSRHCQEKFGYILHHNLDKLYIGAGLFESGFGYCRRIKPIRVIVNGRISDSFRGEKIDIVALQRQSILNYLQSIFPRAEESDFIIESNATQNSRIPHWFSPRGPEDLPEYSNLLAGDNAFCTFSWPLSVVENLVYRLEEYFWDKSSAYPRPKLKDFGQDIKIMACREGSHVYVGVRAPVIVSLVADYQAYEIAVAKLQNNLRGFAESLLGPAYSLDLEVNAHRPYMLGFGSCIECGEEGLVGRGNSISGLISAFRPHSMEAPAGKNPVYHTGRVLNHLVEKLSKAIYQKLGARNTVVALTKNGGSLIPPFQLSIEADINLSRAELASVVETDFLKADYLEFILSVHQVK